jgi:hypothetical protein
MELNNEDQEVEEAEGGKERELEEEIESEGSESKEEKVGGPSRRSARVSQKESSKPFIASSNEKPSQKEDSGKVGGKRKSNRKRANSDDKDGSGDIVKVGSGSAADLRDSISEKKAVDCILNLSSNDSERKKPSWYLVEVEPEVYVKGRGDKALLAYNQANGYILKSNERVDRN